MRRDNEQTPRLTIPQRSMMTMIGLLRKTQLFCLVAALAVQAQPHTYDVATGTAKTFASKWQPIPGYSPKLVLSVDRDQRIGGRQLRRGEEITFTIIPGTQFESGTIAPGQAVRVE